MGAFAYASHGPSLTVTFVPAMALSYGLYLSRTARRPMPDPDRVLPLYLAALAVQFLHFAEEYITGFNVLWPALFGATPYAAGTFVAFNMAAYTAFILGALALYRGVRPPMLLVWFFAVMGVMGNAVLHPIYCLVVGGYFPGLWTSLAYLVLGPLLLRRLWASQASAPRPTPAM